MSLTGQAKVDYQREYMRRRRSNSGSNKPLESIRPNTLDPIRPFEPSRCKSPDPCSCIFCQASQKGSVLKAKPQSHNPMMAGYVPKVGG